MASSGNFGTWNPLADYSSGTTFSNGNCTTALSQQNSYRAVLGPAIPDSGKWYIEFFIDHQTSGFPSDIGVLDRTANTSLDSGDILSNAGSFHIEPMNGTLFSESTSGTSYTGNSGSPAAIGNSDGKVAIAIDRDANKLWFAVNNTWINVGSGVGDPANGNNPAVSSLEQNLSISHGIRQATGTSKVVINCGQDSTFGGLETAGGNADGNGFGDFFYAPPSGFLALCSANLPISDDIDPAQTDDNYIGGKHFNAVEYTGNSTTGQSITGMGFKPDLLWCKMTSSSQNNQLYDSSRLNSRSPTPTPLGLRSDTTGVEFDDQSTGNNNPIISSFDNDGFTLGTSGSGPNDSGRTYIAMGWKANGGTTSSNTDGALTSTVQANQDAGFSICTYTSNGSGSSFGHGLGATPDWFMIKKRDNQARNWYCWHKDLTTPTTAYIRLNLLNGQGNDTQWDSTAPDSTKIYVNKDTTEVNSPSGDSYVCYAWRGIEGYSKFGSYTGSGNTDGTFVYTGFRPKFVFIKKSSEASTTYGWPGFLDIVNDNENDAYFNNWWLDQTVGASGNYPLDFLSNGFKHRNSNTNLDGSGKTYIYCAWGAVPFKYNNTF